MSAGTKLRALRRVAAGDTRAVLDPRVTSDGLETIRRLQADGLLGPKLGVTRKGRRALEAEAFLASAVGPVR